MTGSVLTHLGPSGEAHMVDVSDKAATERVAVAEGRVVMTKATLDLVMSGNAKKGDVQKAYDRTQFLTERKAMMQRWADYLDELRTGVSTVVPFKHKAA